MLAVMLAAMVKPEVATKPSISDDCSERVVAALKQLSHVISAVINALGVVGPTWIKVIFSYPSAIQVKIKQPEAGRINSRATNWFLCFKTSADISRRR